MSPAVRSPAVAGTFYDADPRRLAAGVDALLDAAPRPSERAPRPAGLVVPHAGYGYSGPVAASAYAHLRPHAASYERVVLLGPSHFVPVRGMAVPVATAFTTPLGTMRVDVTGCLQLTAGSGTVSVSDAPHREEHSLEVQLPFLQRMAGERLTLVPVVVGGAAPEAVADALDGLEAAGNPTTLVVVSTDLSHYLDDRRAKQRDRATADAVVRREPQAIGSRDACGAAPLRGLLTWALRHALDVRLLDLRTSGHTAGGRRQVVGYGAFRVDRPVAAS
jgi:MEMO1 family protein